MVHKAMQELVFQFPLDGDDRYIGRGTSSHMRLNGMGISEKHAVLRCDPRNPWISDNNSTFGIHLNGVPVSQSALKSGAVLTVGLQQFRVDIENGVLSLESLAKSQKCEGFKAAHQLIGRDPQNHICLDHPLVSRCHASFKATPQYLQIRDNGSTNGTFVNGKKIAESEVCENDTVHIGPFRFVVRERALHRCDEKNRIRIEARDVSIAYKDRYLLKEVNTTIEPGAFVALLGSSGAGKTTLSRVLTGEIIPRNGEVLVNGLALEKLGGGLGRDVGFVSQQNLLRPELKVFETFIEQSQLRFPAESSKAERLLRVEEIIELLELKEVRNSRVGDLSGGEAKRVHLGVELLASPAMVVLDEPLAGLDPGLIIKFMKLFRRICDRGQTLLLTTHTLEHIELCDRIVFLHKGKMLYEGVPGHLCESLGVSSLAEVYGKASQCTSALFNNNKLHLRDFKGSYLPGEKSRTCWSNPNLIRTAFSHFSLLFKRYTKISVRDKRNFLIFLAQAPLISLFLSGVYRSSTSLFPISFYFCLTVSGLWIGGINSVKEFAREWYLIKRERRAGMILGSYIFAKLSVALFQSLFQAALFSGSLLLAFRNLSFSFSLYVLLCATIFCGSLLGLAVSGFSATVGRAITAMPIVLIPQIFFSGILISFDMMSGWGRALSHLTLSRALFGIMKQRFILGHNLFEPNEWITLFYIITGLIILIFVALHGKTRPRALKI
ncbi:ABC transporter, ATP-binding protein [Chitinispirillum alkaliphilum]|nr:ABC transporter, ATP-binding protein [Chitinispirillum alkaliphilum]